MFLASRSHAVRRSTAFILSSKIIQKSSLSANETLSSHLIPYSYTCIPPTRSVSQLAVSQSCPTTVARDRITELSHIIAENSKILSDFFENNGRAVPSFDTHALDKVDIHPEKDEEAHEARLRLLDATDELNALVRGPRECMKSLGWHDMVSSLSIQAIYRFKIAQAISLDEEVSYTDLSERLNLDVINLRRILRHAMTNRIFREPRKGIVAHTRASRLLAEDEDIQAWIGMFLEDCWLAVAKTVDAMEKYPGSQEPAEAGSALAAGTGNAWFVELAKHPERLIRFGKAMTAHSNGEGYESRFLVDSYDWAALGDATVIDVGGARGAVAFAIAEKFPALKVIVQDLPSMVNAEVSATVPEQLKGRVEFQAHDFFTPQKTEADVYIFRWVFHNWSDKYAVQILRNLAAGLKPGARIVINDGTLPDVGSVPLTEERDNRTMDMLMLTVVNAREREVDDWKGLFETADERYKFVRAYKPKYCKMWIIEAVWNP